MSERSKNIWLINGLLAVILALLAAYYVSVTRPAYADGGGWETGGVMVMSAGGAQERLVLVDTKKQNIMLYKPQAGGLFRLVGARSYQYDVEIEDSDGVADFKAQGITFARAKQLYETSTKGGGPTTVKQP